MDKFVQKAALVYVIYSKSYCVFVITCPGMNVSYFILVFLVFLKYESIR